jgi:hypothetical protein
MDIIDNSCNEIGTWDFYKDETISREIVAYNMEIDIGEMIKDINEIIEMHIGQFTNMSKLIKELKLSIKNLYMSENNKKEIYQKVHDENGIIHIMFVMEKHENTENCICNFMSCLEYCKSCKIDIRLTISRPTNNIAQMKCNNLMNYKINKRLLSKISHESPRK